MKEIISFRLIAAIGPNQIKTVRAGGSRFANDLNLQELSVGGGEGETDSVWYMRQLIGDGG
jgi:hypothetical protein